MSTSHSRYISSFIAADLKERMVFIGGPRQVGKTTLAQSFISDFQRSHPAYLNWDFPQHQKKIRNGDWPAAEKVIVFDEIHKMTGWRNLIKGYFDVLKQNHQFIVTGSARLDYYKKGGDSLLGRYRYYRLHPFSLNEVGATSENLRRLFKFGGFPESFLHRDEKFLRRWHTERLYRLIHTDLRDLERVSDIDKVQLLAEELPNRVGSPISVKALAGDLQVDFKTMRRWLGILDMLYYSFQIAPYGSPKIRAVKKEQKLYLWDFSQIEEPGFRFENMVACQLLKHCHFLQDTEGHRMELRYIRDTDKREIDFLVLQNKRPLFAVECKLSDKELSPHLKYFAERTPVPEFFQVHLEGSSRRVSDRIMTIPFLDFCKLKKFV
jgi:predicted AAA+ superfamily ATPase